MISPEELAEAVHPAMDAGVIKGFVDGLRAERESFYWEILGGSSPKVTIVFPTEE